MILDGSNADDLSDYRPGMKALTELNISTPYIVGGLPRDKVLGISAKEVRGLISFFNSLF